MWIALFVGMRSEIMIKAVAVRCVESLKLDINQKLKREFSENGNKYFQKNVRDCSGFPPRMSESVWYS